jgi:hypothetical protein
VTAANTASRDNQRVFIGSPSLSWGRTGASRLVGVSD